MAVWPAKRKVVVSVADNTYLAHHGILGMKWGIRRWQNADGSYNAAGKLRYGDGPKKNTRKAPAKSSQTSKTTAKKTASQTNKTPVQNTPTNQPKPVSEMTDQEIKDFLVRRDLEAKYLAAITPKEQAKAESLTEKYMKQFGTKLMDKIVQDAATQLGASIVKSILGGNSKDNQDDKKKDDKKSSDADREKSRAQTITNDKAAYEFKRLKKANRAADKATAQQKRDERAAAWREREAKWKAEEDAWYADAQRELEERRRRNVIALPAGR